MKRRGFLIFLTFLLMITLLPLARADGPNCGDGCDDPDGVECNKYTDPTGSFSTSNTTTCDGNIVIAVTKTSTLTVLTKQDIDEEICPDCSVNYPEDSIPESGIKWFETGGGTLTDDTGSTGTWVAPNTPENNMGIILKFNDAGNYEDDGGLTQAASILIDAVVPNHETSTNNGNLGDAWCAATYGAGYQGGGSHFGVTVRYKNCAVSFSGLQVTENVSLNSNTCGTPNPCSGNSSWAITAGNAYDSDDWNSICYNGADPTNCTIVCDQAMSMSGTNYGNRTITLNYGASGFTAPVVRTDF